MNANCAQFAALMNSLRQAYAEARKHWRDEVAQHFERRYWDDIERRTQSVLDGLDQFENALERAEFEIQRLDR